MLKAAHLKMGKVVEEPQEDETKVGTVIKQKPSPGLPIAPGESVDITMAIKKRN
jgi:beta-lactam-binding protein with PASTA domain